MHRSTSLSKSTTYTLVAESDAGRVSKNFKVNIRRRVQRDKPCNVNVVVTGRYSNYTNTVGVFRGNPSASGKLLFKKPTRKVKDHRSGRSAQSRKARFTVREGYYYLMPRGGGKDRRGNFGTIHRPVKRLFRCTDGAPIRLAFKADHAEY